MSPEIFFILLLLTVALIGGVFVLIYVLKPRKILKDNLSEDDVKNYFEDSLLHKATSSLKHWLKHNYQCPKCHARRYEPSHFDEDLYEVYCYECGFKNFYHLDLLAGIDRPTKKVKSTWPKDWLGNSKESIPCSQCKGVDFSDFKMVMDVRYKFSGYGDTKKVTLFLNSCRKCGLVNFFDRARA